VGTVEDLQAQTRIKTQRARQAVETTFDLLSFDLIEGSLWIDVRKAQDPKRGFGTAPTAAWSAFRQRVPLGQGAAPEDSQSASLAAAEFLKSTAASSFYRGSGEP
jgi:histidine ammonia-lyase